MGNSKKIVIIGGVACGAKAAARARRLDSEAEITILERGNYASYAGCGLPFLIAGAVPSVDTLLTMPWGAIRDAEFFKNTKGINLLLRTEALKIDRENKTVTAKNLDTGETTDFPYDKLVIASGANPVAPPIEGMDLKNVFQLRRPDDAVGILNCIEEVDAENAVIVGGGRIALEVVDALMAQAVDSTIIELMDQVLPNVVDSDIAGILTVQLRKHGADVRTGERVEKLVGDDNGNVCKVITSKGEYKADFVVVAVGVKPNVEIAREAGLDITDRGTIAVDDRLRTSDPDIYAGGDCILNDDLVTGGKSYIPLGSTANKHGRVIGTNITGGDATFPGVLGTGFMKTVGLNVVRTGLSSAIAEKNGYKIETFLLSGHDVSHFYPGGKDMIIKLIADAADGRILGAQMIGAGNVPRRLDAVAAMITFKATAAQVGNLDMGYAPPFASAMDLLIHAANSLQNKLDGIAVSMSIMDFKKKLESDKDFCILDVRAESEIERSPVDKGNSRVLNIPIERFRDEIDRVPKDRDVLVFCATGTRSYEVQRALAMAGRESVFVEGGMHVLEKLG